MNKILKHAVTLCIIILTVPLCPLLLVFCDQYADYTYFVNFIFALVVVVSTGLRLFGRIDSERYVTMLVCDAVLIVSANKLYSFQNLAYIKKHLNVHSTYMGMIEITILSIAVLLMIKLIVWAKEKDKAEARNSNVMLDTGTENTPSTKSSIPVSNNSTRETNSFLYIIVVSAIVILGLIGSIATIYIFRKPISNGTWLDAIPYLLLIIGLAIVVLFLLNILTLAAKSIVNLIRYKDNGENILAKKITKYRLSITITFVLFAVVYFFKGDYSLELFINLINDDLSDFLSLPLAFCVILAAFFIIVLLVQIILKIFSINVDGFSLVVLEEIGKKMLYSLYEIAKKLYFIVINTIKSAIDFAEFIPDYFETIKMLVMGEDISSPTSSQQQTNNSQTTNNTRGDGND